jgi:hypothetical protein
MGVWSTALYGGDAALDLRDEVKDLLRAPLDEDGLLAILRVRHPGLDETSDEDHADLWLALADQLHLHAVAAPKALATARAIIDGGLDLDVKRGLGMSEADLKKRAKILDALAAKWATPHPKPTKRKVQDKPEALLFEAGDCLAYPVSPGGAAINPYFASAEKDPSWTPGGYGAAVVLARGLYCGVFAWYAVARLALTSAEPPTLAACAGAQVDSQSSPLAAQLQEQPELSIAAGRLPPNHAKRLRLATVGRLAVDEKAVREDLAAVFAPDFTPAPSLADALSAWGTRAPSSIPVARYANQRSP